jgi:hypothetical protein
MPAPTSLPSHALVCTLLFAAAATAQADVEDSLVLDRFSLTAGTFRSDIGLSARLGGNAEIGESEIDFNDDFDFSADRKLPIFELGWRPFDRHEFRLRHFNDRQSRSAVLSREIRFEGDVYPVDAEARGAVELDIIELDYTYWAWTRPRNAFGLRVGALRYTLDVELEASIESPEIGSVELEGSASRAVNAPVIGAVYRHAFSRQWRGHADFSAVKLRWDDIDGRVLEGSLGIEYLPFDHFSLMLEYERIWLRAEFEESAVDARADLRLSGPQLKARLRF